MVLFANINAVDLKQGNIIMFTMVSSCPNQVAPRVDQCLGGQFACALMSYSMFLTIVDVTNGGLTVVVRCVLAMRIGLT